MVDPTSDLGEDATEETAHRCATCGDPIVQSADHRTITWIDDDDEVQAAHFCDETCRMRWQGD